MTTWLPLADLVVTKVMIDSIRNCENYVTTNCVLYLTSPIFRPSTFQTDATFRTNSAANPATRQHHQHAPHAEPASGGQLERLTDPAGVESGQRPPEPVAPVASVHHAELGGGSGGSGDNGTGRPADGCPKYDGRTNWQHGKRLGIVGLEDMRDVLNYYFTV